MEHANKYNNKKISKTIAIIQRVIIVKKVFKILPLPLCTYLQSKLGPFSKKHKMYTVFY
jgi:hypothetical protein